MMFSPERAKYNGPAVQLFGLAVVSALPPDRLADIEEAGKCIAFDRGTAAVFHLMRVLEVGLRQLAAYLQIDYMPSWESYIKHISDKVEQRHKDKPEEWKAKEPLFKAVLGDLDAVKIAWRNPTMHIERRYTVKEAEGVFDAVRALMLRIVAVSEMA